MEKGSWKVGTYRLRVKILQDYARLIKKARITHFNPIEGRNNCKSWIKIAANCIQWNAIHVQNTVEPPVWR